MALLSQKLKRRIVIAVTSEKYGKELIDAIEGASSEILTGNTAPDSSLGNDGNLYVNLSNGDLYIKIDGSWQLQGNVGGVSSLDVEEPVGFKDPDNVSMSINDATRTVTISPVSGSFTYFVSGKKFTSSGAKSITWSNSEGLHFIYLDDTEALKEITVFDPELITDNTFVCIVYWDPVANKHIYFANERHGIHMATYTHLYLHNTRGAQFDRGLALNDIIEDADGSNSAHAKFTVKTGVIWDEDIKINIPAQTSFPVFYKSGSVWKRKEAGEFPIIHSGLGLYSGNRIAYNLNNNGSWSLVETDNNKWVLVHVFATNDIEYPVVCIQGQQQYNSKTDARNGAKNELQQLSGLPFAEFVPLGSVIYETKDSYTNSIKARIVSTDTGEEYEDHRGEIFRPGTL